MTAQVKADANGDVWDRDVVDAPVKFPLVRYFLVASVLAITAVTVVTAFLFVRFAEHSFILSSEARSRDEAAHFVELFRHSVWLPNQQENPDVTLMQIDSLALDTFAHDIAFGLRIAQVNLLSAGGTVVYSTDRSLIGAALEPGARYERVLVSDMPDAGFMPDVALALIDGERRRLDVVETLAPLRDPASGPGEVGRTIGVLEIVHDITEDLADAKAASVRTAAIGSASMGFALVLVLFLIVRRADARIDRGREQLLEQRSRLMESEDSLQLSNARLEETLTELTETQQQIVQQERLRALGQMASGVAHDFNNLLTPIVGYSELLLTSPRHLGNKDTVERYVRLIYTAGQDAANVVKNLREFYRAHDEMEDFVPIALGELVEQAISLTQAKWKDEAQAEGKTITIRTDLDPVPPVWGSQSQLREVLINLIINAADAIAGDGTISLRVYPDGGQIALEVADTGLGMTEQVRRQCLDPFFTTKGTVGTGLGLAMAAGVIRRHRGSIDVASKEGEGTTFTIRLPVHVGDAGDANIEGAGSTQAPAMRVLVVDDEEAIRELLADYLTADGHTVETAADGREGLERYSAGSFDVVVTDRAMPEMNGDQLADAIRKEKGAGHVIMLTGYGDAIQADGELPDGVDFVLNKPVRRVELQQALVTVAG